MTDTASRCFLTCFIRHRSGHIGIGKTSQAISDVYLLTEERRPRKLKSMTQPKYLLTFVTGKHGELFLHADNEGLSVLIRTLQQIKDAVDRGACEHDHLMSEAWGGSELSEQKGIQDGELIHHLKIFGWNQEWTVKHGFKA